MKKITLLFAAMFCFLTISEAQTYVGELDNWITSSVPGEFTVNGQTYVTFNQYNEHDWLIGINIYADDFTSHIADITGFEYLISTKIVDYNNGISRSLYCTQNLFNTDEHFEYFEGDMDSYGNFTTIRMKSTNGSTLWSYNLEFDLCDFGVLIINDTFYLVVAGTNCETGEKISHLYLISQPQGLTEIDTPFPISAFPTLLNQEQQITVELGEGNNAKEITVVNSIGQVVKRVPVEEGQRTVTIPANDLNRGLNVLNAKDNRGRSSCKVIVK